MAFLPYRKLRISYKVKNKFDFIAMREFPREARKTHMALQMLSYPKRSEANSSYTKTVRDWREVAMAERIRLTVCFLLCTF